jgi:hypothetical protein
MVGLVYNERSRRWPSATLTAEQLTLIDTISVSRAGEHVTVDCSVASLIEEPHGGASKNVYSRIG